MDVVSGSWPGEIFFFKGRGSGKFDPPAKLQDKAGKSINIGGGIMQNTADQLLVAGDAKFEEKDGKRFIVYEGQRTEFKPGQRGGITGTASVVSIADLNADGKLDLIVGNINGGVFCILNEGTAKAWQFGEGKLWIYRNEGTAAAPKLAAGRLFQDGAETGRVPAG